MKCNPDPTIIKILATLNGHFDCASKVVDIILYNYIILSDIILNNNNNNNNRCIHSFIHSFIHCSISFNIVQFKKIYKFYFDHFLIKHTVFVLIEKNVIKNQKLNFPVKLCDIRFLIGIIVFLINIEMIAENSSFSPSF